jgi:hypothetical protein
MRRRILFSLASVLVVAIIVGAYFVGRSSPSHEINKSHQSTSAGVSSSLPVIECPSSFGAGSVPPSSYPAEEATSLPKSEANELNFYSDSTRSIVPILAPRGWKCTFDEGADGSMFMSIYPATQRAPIGVHSSFSSTSKGISAETTSVCQGCAADLTCPVFVNAESDLGYTGIACPSTAPPGETDRFVDGSRTGNYGIADVYDPPLEEGTDVGSGGKYPTNGVLELLPDGNDWTSAAESCVLPETEKGLCKAITSEFVTVEWWQ